MLASTVSDPFYTEYNIPTGGILLGNVSTFAGPKAGRALRDGTKVKAFLSTLYLAGKKGVTIEQLSKAVYGKIERLETLKVYFAYDIRPFGIRTARFGNRYFLILRTGQTIEDVKKVLGL